MPIASGAKKISSEKTKEAFSEMLHTMNEYGYEINTVYLDNCNEYDKNFDKFLKDNHIIHILGNVDDKRMTSPIERFNGTLRLSMAWRSTRWHMDELAKTFCPQLLMHITIVFIM